VLSRLPTNLGYLLSEIEQEMEGLAMSAIYFEEGEVIEENYSSSREYVPP